MYEGIKDIFALLDAHRLKEALTQLQGICSQAKDWQLRTQIEEAQTSYGYMLQYARQGLDDPARKDFYRRMLRTAYELTDWANVSLLSEKSSGGFYENMRTFTLHPPHAYAELQLQLEAYTEDMATAPLLFHDKQRLEAETTQMAQRHESALNELFDKTWTSIRWSESELAEATTLLQSVMVSANDLSVLVSAVTLNLQYIFDARKLAFLFDAYAHEDLRVNQRALTGIALTILLHGKRISLYPELAHRLNLLGEEEKFANNLYTLQLQLLLTRETDKIDRKMREEILPEVIKQSKLMSQKFKFEENEDMEEQNPEWQEWMDKSGVNKNMRKLSEWQMAGADLYMGSFAQLKSYPFFNRTSHWFYPFDINHPDLATFKKEYGGHTSSMPQLLCESPFFCNSDKYSFCLAIQQMPANMKAMGGGSAQWDMMGAEEKQALEEKIKTPQDAKDISRLYIQDLHRFFKLHKSDKERGNPFAGKLDLWNNDLLKDILLKGGHTQELADYLLQYEHYEEALTLYIRLTEGPHASAEVWQKAGYILQRQKDYARAIDFYQHADLLNANNLWTNKHLAQCYRNTNDYASALEFYRKVEQVEPDNLNIALQIGQCLTKMEKYGEALSYFYKVEYLEKSPNNARRAIAWCSFVSGKYAEALKYYRLLLEEPSPKATDWMNAGHVSFVTGNIPLAIEQYGKAHEGFKSHNEFLDAFMEDKDTLMEQGKKEEDIQILLDLLV